MDPLFKKVFLAKLKFEAAETVASLYEDLYGDVVRCSFAEFLIEDLINDAERIFDEPFSLKSIEKDIKEIESSIKRFPSVYRGAKLSAAEELISSLVEVTSFIKSNHP